MNRWENKEAFIKWVEDKKDKATKDSVKLFERNDFSKDFKTYTANASIHIEVFKKVLDDKVLDFFNEIMYVETRDIEISYLRLFLTAVDHVNFFENSEFNTSKDSKKHEDRIRTLKTKAIELQYYSPTQIRIRLPIQPHVSIYEMVYHLNRNEVDTQTIKYLLKYFRKERMQKETEAYRIRRKERNNLSQNMGKTPLETIELIKNRMHYYEPKMK